MSYSVELSDNFKKEAKRLVKNIAPLKTELAKLFIELEENPTLGTRLATIFIKSVLAIASKNKGKSGGARVLSFVKVTQTTVLLFSIYSKGEVDNLTDKQIQELIKDYL
ncbi:MAG: hypothetical protein IPQ10_09880 [Saprospiraceae bacterium]|nr:hypothetical protein [Saprospiraceae bacterium]